MSERGGRRLVRHDRSRGRIIEGALPPLRLVVDAIFKVTAMGTRTTPFQVCLLSGSSLLLTRVGCLDTPGIIRVVAPIQTRSRYQLRGQVVMHIPPVPGFRIQHKPFK